MVLAGAALAADLADLVVQEGLAVMVVPVDMGLVALAQEVLVLVAPDSEDAVLDLVVVALDLVLAMDVAVLLAAAWGLGLRGAVLVLVLALAEVMGEV